MKLGSSTCGRFELSDNPRNSFVKLLDNNNGVVLILNSVEEAKELVGRMPSAPDIEWKED